MAAETTSNKEKGETGETVGTAVGWFWYCLLLLIFLLLSGYFYQKERNLMSQHARVLSSCETRMNVLTSSAEKEKTQLQQKMEKSMVELAEFQKLFKKIKSTIR